MTPYDKLRSSADVYRELTLLSRLDRSDKFKPFGHYGKRRERLVKMYWLFKRMEARA